MAPKAESFTIGCMIKGFTGTFTGIFGQVTVREVLWCHCEEISADGLFGSGTDHEQSKKVQSLEVFVKRHRLY